jgi:tryptophan 7-halogenase
MRANAADAFRLSVEDGQVVIEFGRGGRGGGDGAEVVLTDRVVLDSVTAQRLRHGLREALARPAPAALATTAEPDPVASLAGPSGTGATPLNLPPDPAAEAAARLLERLRGLDVPYQYERSFRLAQGSLQANRFLASINRADLGDSARERALAVAQALGMPATALAAAHERFHDAHCLHFGFEAGDAGLMCKLYLERQVPTDEVVRAASLGEGVLLHLAYKWLIDGSAHVVTRYDWFPGLSPQGMDARMRAVYGAQADGEAAAIACATLALAAAREPALQYLEVHEPDNGRRSFDLNLYDAGLQVRDLLPLLLRMRDLYGIRPGQFQALVDQIRHRALGHLAGGMHRDGRDFFNVYYGVTGFPQFAGRLA